MAKVVQVAGKHAHQIGGRVLEKASTNPNPSGGLIGHINGGKNVSTKQAKQPTKGSPTCGVACTQLRATKIQLAPTGSTMVFHYAWFLSHHCLCVYVGMIMKE
jgi:hypothetical protein